MDHSLFRYIWRNTRREQLFILGLILVSLPFYFASLDVPKRIVNDALQGRAFTGGKTLAPILHLEVGLPSWLGGSKLVLFPGFELEQMSYLLAMSFVFLALVLINGAFKLVINIRRGILGERMLVRVREDLFALLLRFRPEDIRQLKPAEAASMIKDEVEPIGDFAGDAFVTPAFLGTQALTALTFILVQSVWLGAISLAVVLIQAVLIPRLRRRQLILGRERQIASRKLAGRIGAVVEVQPIIHANGAAGWTGAGVTARLLELLRIRIALFKRKFAVKYLNNLLAQVTPFFFYSIGGYFALKGHLDVGQLVAVIIAYRDLPPPIKELIDWDQQKNDVLVKYDQVASQFADRPLLPETGKGPGPLDLSKGDRIEIAGLEVVDRQGATQLSDFTGALPWPSHVAILGGASPAGEALARVLARQMTEYRGSVRIGGFDLASLSSEAHAREIAYVAADPGLLPDSIRDNVAMSLRRHTLPEGSPAATDPDHDDWLDLAAAGVSSRAELDERILGRLGRLGMLDDLYRVGLNERPTSTPGADLEARIVEARRQILAELEASGLVRMVEPFDPDRFNTNATIAENLLFGLAVAKGWSEGELADNRVFRRCLTQAGLSTDLAAVGLKVAETTLEMIADLPPGHALLERYSLIAPADFEDIRQRVDLARGRSGDPRFNRVSKTRFIGLALKYIDARHRFGLLDDALKSRIIDARRRIRDATAAIAPAPVELFDRDRVIMSAPLRDNLLFGRLAFGLPTTEQGIWDVVRRKLSALGLEAEVQRLGLDYNVGPGGKLLSNRQRAAIGLVRAVVRRPRVLVVDGALAAFSPAEAAQILAELRQELAGRMLIVGLSDAAATDGFDIVLRASGTTIDIETPARAASGAPVPAMA